MVDFEQAQLDKSTGQYILLTHSAIARKKHTVNILELSVEDRMWT